MHCELWSMANDTNDKYAKVEQIMHDSKMHKKNKKVKMILLNRWCVAIILLVTKCVKLKISMTYELQWLDAIGWSTVIGNGIRTIKILTPTIYKNLTFGDLT